MICSKIMAYLKHLAFYKNICYNIYVSISYCLLAVVVIRVFTVPEILSLGTFLFLMLSSCKKHKRPGQKGLSLLFTIKSEPQQMATKALIECMYVYFDGCFFYIDRSRKVPPTFFLGEPQGLPLLYKQNEKECVSL